MSSNPPDRGTSSEQSESKQQSREAVQLQCRLGAISSGLSLDFGLHASNLGRNWLGHYTTLQETAKTLTCTRMLMLVVMSAHASFERKADDVARSRHERLTLAACVTSLQQPSRLLHRA